MAALLKSSLMVEGTDTDSAPDPEVASTAKRRQFSGAEKRRILAEADRCTKPGEIGAPLAAIREAIMQKPRP